MYFYDSILISPLLLILLCLSVSRRGQKAIAAAAWRILGERLVVILSGSPFFPLAQKKKVDVDIR